MHKENALKTITKLLCGVALVAFGLSGCAAGPDVEINCSLSVPGAEEGTTTEFCLALTCTGESCDEAQVTCAYYETAFGVGLGPDAEVSVSSTSVSSCSGDLVSADSDEVEGNTLTVECYATNDGGKTACASMSE